MLALDAQGGEPTKARPTELRLDELEVLPSLFQPRISSLDYSAWVSANHVEKLTKAATDEGKLDPVDVVSFGPSWFLVDGHHRRSAYTKAGWRRNQLIPVRPHYSEARGLERVAWAQTLSTDLNRKDKLPMTDDDRFDAAWQRVVAWDHRGMAQQVADATGIGLRTVRYMVKHKKQLLALTTEQESLDIGAPPECVPLYSLDELYSWHWQAARVALLKAQGRLSDDLEDRDVHAERVRKLAIKLTPAFRARVDPAVLYDVLEGFRPGLGSQLAEVARERASSLFEAEEDGG